MFCFSDYPAATQTKIKSRGTIVGITPSNATTVTPTPFDWTGFTELLFGVSSIVNLAIQGYRKLRDWLRRRKAYEPIDYSIHFK